MLQREWLRLLKKGTLNSKENNVIKAQEVKTIASIGGGPIGAGWAAHFLSKGLKVKSYLHSEDELEAYKIIIETAWESLKELGLKENASLENLSITLSLEEALDSVEFVQESIPEIIEIKQRFYKKVDQYLNEDVIIASSTSGLLISDIVKYCETANRTIVGHPFNPPYLLPLVEVVSGNKTSKATESWITDFYKLFDKVPLVLKKEIPGFIATRLQEALWREALHMVANDEATPEQIDLALINGPAPRMAFQGQCMAFHVACGEGGMATNLDQFGPALKLPWTRLVAPELDKELRDKMVDGCNKMTDGRNFKEMANQRDRAIVSVLNALKDFK